VTDDQRIEMVHGQMDHIFALCQSFAEVEEEDNCRALYEEYEEWIVAEQEEGSYEVMWAPNFSLQS